MEPVRLRYMGYWHSLKSPNLPDPAWFIDAAWDEGEKQKVLQYLKQSFPAPWIYLGRSWCRFRCGKDVAGRGEYTDGTFVWPEGLTHYIEYHQVRLPQEVIDHILIRKRPVNVHWSDSLQENIDSSWWRD